MNDDIAHHRRMKKLALILVVIASIACMGFSFAPTQSTITLTGTGKVQVQPDFATISLGVETKNLADNEKKVKELIETLGQHGVEESDIKNTWFNIYHDHYCGHRVNNQLSVTVRNIEDLGKIIAATTSAGATFVSGIQFGIEDSSVAYNQAIEKAIESAKQKASVFGDLQIISIKEIQNYGYEHDNVEITATVEIVFSVSSLPTPQQQ